jgi:hypothetical protein
VIADRITEVFDLVHNWRVLQDVAVDSDNGSAVYLTVFNQFHRHGQTFFCNNCFERLLSFVVGTTTGSVMNFNPHRTANLLKEGVETRIPMVALWLRQTMKE